MADTLVNLVVIVLVVGTIALALFTYLTNKKRRSGSQFTEKMFLDGIAAQQFLPDQVSWFGGTGIAMKHGEDRLALQSKGGAQFYSVGDITAVKAYESTFTARPLGAAPGVVELKQFQVYNLEITFKQSADPVKILLKDADQMRQWEQLLKTTAHLPG